MGMFCVLCVSVCVHLYLNMRMCGGVRHVYVHPYIHSMCVLWMLISACVFAELRPSAGQPGPAVESGAAEEEEPADASAQDAAELARGHPH